MVRASYGARLQTTVAGLVLWCSTISRAHQIVGSGPFWAPSVFQPSRLGDTAKTAIPPPLPPPVGAESGALVAHVLGWAVGLGSALLYAPIGVRVVRQGAADGLTLSTWWLRTAAYTCGTLYAWANGYPFSTYCDTAFITWQAASLLVLVAFYQGRWDGAFAGKLGLFAAATLWATTLPPRALASAQVAYTILNVSAVAPQVALNWRRSSSGDYSPLTAGLAVLGSSVRIFTTLELAGGDRLLLAGFAASVAANGALLLQVVFYGTCREGHSLAQVFGADFKTPPRAATAATAATPPGSGL